MNTMKRTALGIVALLVPLTLTAPAQAVRPSIGGQVAPPNICHSKWIRSLGNPPCETMTEPESLRCDLDRPYYETQYRFRYVREGAWSQWWLYYRWYRPAPKTAC